MRQPHILLVDDEADIREVAALSLQTLGGWRVSSASGGAAAIAVARAECPDVILLDVMMPELDGPTTLARLRGDARTHTIPVIFLTAKAQHADQRGLARLDVSGVLTKPFDPMTLSDQINAILDKER